ncbi:DUF362 domain-containing protein [Nitrospirota bacterium]
MSTRVAIVKSTDREIAIPRAIDLLGIGDVLRNKNVLLKPNFNTADPYPASTHNNTLRALIIKLNAMGAARVTVGDRSGPVKTSGVLVDKGIPALCAELGAELINFEELPESQWEHIKPEGLNWRNGFLFAKPVLEADAVVTTCCLKTHGFGGGITVSLKLTIGMVSGRNMPELHTSFLSQKKMIAETNLPYSPALILMDALEVFTDKGPMSGPIKSPGLIVAGTDRVAIDAVGMAILKEVGSNAHVMKTPPFEQPQISRAIELGIGITGPEEIELLTDETESSKWAERIKKTLFSG